MPIISPLNNAVNMNADAPQETTNTHLVLHTTIVRKSAWNNAARACGQTLADWCFAALDAAAADAAAEPTPLLDHLVRGLLDISRDAGRKDASLRDLAYSTLQRARGYQFTPADRCWLGQRPAGTKVTRGAGKPGRSWRATVERDTALLRAGDVFRGWLVLARDEANERVRYLTYTATCPEGFYWVDHVNPTGHQILDGTGSTLVQVAHWPTEDEALAALRTAQREGI